MNEANDDVSITHGTPLHFDDSGKVKVIDVDASNVNSATSTYRRTVIMVQVDENVSYYLDFFRVVGGDTHTFSFHAQSQEATAVQGLTMTKDPGGREASYASHYDENGNWINVPFGQDPNSPAEWTYDTVYPRGYTWMKNVRRDNEPENTFAVDFAITDYRNAVSVNQDIYLRMTQLNDFTADEVALVGGMVPVKNANSEVTGLTDTLEYVLVQRRGENLDSLFTTVYEPYRNTRYVQTIETAPATVVSGEQAAGDTVKAVKVSHTNGRVDYIVYATNNTVTYDVGGVFQFRGFVGVYSLNEEGEVVYRYVCDGDIIETATQTPASYQGTVVNFEKGLTVNNYIDVKFDGEVDANSLVGKFIRIENDGLQNAVYEIEAVGEAPNADGSIRLYTGMVTLIRSLRDIADAKKGYIYNIEDGQKAVISMAYMDDNERQLLPFAANLTTEKDKFKVNDEILVSVNISHKLETRITAGEMKISYDHTKLTFDPDASQLGGATVTDENGVITISDYGTDKELGEGLYVLSFTAKETGEAKVALTSAGFSTEEGVTTWTLRETELTGDVEISIEEIEEEPDSGFDAKQLLWLLLIPVVLAPVAVYFFIKKKKSTKES